MEYINYNIRKIFFPLAVTCFVVLLMSGCNKKETYTVTFDANGGTGTMQQQVFTEGEQQALSKNTFTREGYIFSGWNGNGANYIDEQKITVTCDMTMYAQWTSNGTNPSPDPSPTPGPTPSNTVTVTFNANGGTGEMLVQTFNVGESQNLFENTYTRENYLFVGWNTASDGSGTTYVDRQLVILTENIILYAKWSLCVTGNIIGRNYVDLGLPSGTKWATYNVGATVPEGYGDYYAWGETTSKETYSWSTYRWCNGSAYTLTKYNTNGSCGTIDNRIILEPSDDAATVNWGSAWRIPTSDEMSELKNNCTVTWTTLNGVNGCLFIGQNGNSLFLPAAGWGINSSILNVGSYGNYWSSSLCSDTYASWYFCIKSDDCFFQGTFRCYGFSVRPVCVN